MSRLPSGSPQGTEGGVSAYRGRFAPSPTGPLHIGSLVAALASFLDARAHRGAWIVRIEDVDGPRTVPGAADDILATLARLGMHSDEPPVWQSRRFPAYEAAFERLRAAGFVYPCGCTRREIADSLLNAHARHATLAYPGTCRDGLHGRAPRAWRLRVPDVGDFVLKRADGQWAYQLAVVVDDDDAGTTHIVRGADLLDSTARQIYLQQCLHVTTPDYLHVPVVTNADGEKLSKQTGAMALNLDDPVATLAAAARHLGIEMPPPGSLDAFYSAATAEWAKRFGPPQ
jgi:glutamyl-Q tRNA(Asp) synthetase